MTLVETLLVIALAVFAVGFVSRDGRDGRWLMAVSALAIFILLLMFGGEFASDLL